MINLIPYTLREERTYGRRNRTMVFIITIFVITAALVASVMLFSVNLVDAEYDEVSTQITGNEAVIVDLESKTSEVSAIEKKLETTYEIFSSSIKFSEIIPAIGGLLPSGSTINGLTLTGGNTDPLALEVNLSDPNLAPVLVQNLINSELFEAADVGSLSSSGEASDDQYAFRATVNISFTGSAEAKKKAEAAAAAQAAQEEELRNGGQQ